ncbi:MAG: penicillin-binding protein 2 [Hyphomonadaceae bacterium]|nr:penicillin-binding protein 2 [Hyphomonadaceae bacterium]
MSRDWRNQFPSRRNMFLVGGGVLFAGLTIRLAELQLFRQAEFETKARETRIRLEPAPPHRGTIYDRTGRVLAGSKRNFYVTLRPELAGDRAQIIDVIDRLSRIVPLSESRKRSVTQEATTGPRFRDILVADDLTWEEFAQVNVMSPELSGVSAEVGELRSYPLQAAFYHTIGYVQKANEADITRMTEIELKSANESLDSPAGKARAATVRRLYRHPAMRVGKSGIEAYGELELKGDPGKIRMLQNAGGRVIDRLPSEDLAGKPGAEVVLSIDAELQNYAISRFGTEAGSAVVIDVASGDVVCMMSTPAPDPNAFVSGIGSTLFKSLQTDERNPLYHKAYDGVYPPGSTFKIVVAAAALESGAMKPEDTVACPGKAWYYNRFYNCWRPEGHGTVNLHTGIQKSCDCYFYRAAERTGIEAIADVAKRFGLGHRYELGLTGGKSGSVPNDAWKRKVVGEQWYAGDTISAGIGQGYVTSTPFQLAVMCARIAGGANVPDPHVIVSGMKVPDNTIMPMGEFKPGVLEAVRAGMFAVTSEGGGTAIRYGALDEKNELPAPYTGARMAGKSGSAQVRIISAAERDSRGRAISNDKLPWKLRDHALFVAYAPTDKPRYAVAVVVEHGGSGSSVAAPFARDILAHALKYDTGARKAFVPQQREVAGNEATPT